MFRPPPVSLPEVPTPTMVLLEATRFIPDSEIVPLTWTVVGELLWIAERNALVDETVTVDPPAPPVVPAPNPVGLARICASVLVTDSVTAPSTRIPVMVRRAMDVRMALSLSA
jgi:hypothetical protein